MSGKKKFDSNAPDIRDATGVPFHDGGGRWKAPAFAALIILVLLAFAFIANARRDSGEAPVDSPAVEAADSV